MKAIHDDNEHIDKVVMNILPPSQNVSKNELCIWLKIWTNTFIFVDQLLLTFWDGWSTTFAFKIILLF